MLSSFDLVSNNHGKILKVLADDVKARKNHIIHELYAFYNNKRITWTDKLSFFFHVIELLWV